MIANRASLTKIGKNLIARMQEAKNSEIYILNSHSNNLVGDHKKLF